MMGGTYFVSFASQSLFMISNEDDQIDRKWVVAMSRLLPEMSSVVNQ